MKKYFNTTGVCFPERHYMVYPLRDIEDQIMELIDKGQYFLIHAPRQTGKTTFLHALTHKLNAKGDYIAATVSVEMGGVPGFTVEQAYPYMISSFYRNACFFLEPQYCQNT